MDQSTKIITTALTAYVSYAKAHFKYEVKAQKHTNRFRFVLGHYEGTSLNGLNDGSTGSTLIMCQNNTVMKMLEACSGHGELLNTLYFIKSILKPHFHKVRVSTVTINGMDIGVLEFIDQINPAILEIGAKSYLGYYKSCIATVMCETSYTVVTLVGKLISSWEEHLVHGDVTVNGSLSCCENEQWFCLPNAYLQENLSPETEVELKELYEKGTGYKIDVINDRKHNLYGFIFHRAPADTVI
jgi:hypothetical protein